MEVVRQAVNGAIIAKAILTRLHSSCLHFSHIFTYLRIFSLLACTHHVFTSLLLNPKQGDFPSLESITNVSDETNHKRLCAVPRKSPVNLWLSREIHVSMQNGSTDQNTCIHENVDQNTHIHENGGAWFRALSPLSGSTSSTTTTSVQSRLRQKDRLAPPLHIWHPWYIICAKCKGRVLLPNRMNFWKNSKRPLTPPHFWKIILQYF